MPRRLFPPLLILGLAPSPFLASAPASTPFQQVDPDRMDAFRRELTLRLLHRLEDPDFRFLLSSRLTPGIRRLPLAPLLQDYTRLWPAPEHKAFAEQVQELDRDVRRTKGLEAHSQSILALEVIWPREGPRSLDWETALFAVAPAGPKRAVTQLEAYDRHGALRMLDARTPPAVPVILAGVDRGEAKRAGIALLNEGLAKARLAPAPPPPPPAPAPIPCSKLTWIRLNDDQEPWWKGAAEVYAFTAGVDPTEPKPALKVIDLPYLAYDHTDYHPGQLILFWTDWRFGAADFQLWESDDHTNYQDVLTAILSAVTTAMELGGAPAFSWIPALAQAIIRAMPSAWYKDNDDYLDTFYTLEQDRAYERHPGAGGNAALSLEPYVLRPRRPADPGSPKERVHPEAEPPPAWTPSATVPAPP